MSDRYAEVMVLAEDSRSANLLRRYAQRALNLNTRRIRQITSPSGKGDAKRWVIGQYAGEVGAIRAGHRRAALVVHIDADIETVARRSEQLAQALQQAALEPRSSAERIAHAIPRRHTETWLCVLTGINSDEDQDCKRRGMPANPDAAVAPAALRLYELTRNNAASAPLPSLAAVIVELRRLE